MSSLPNRAREDLQTLKKQRRKQQEGERWTCQEWGGHCNSQPSNQRHPQHHTGQAQSEGAQESLEGRGSSIFPFPTKTGGTDVLHIVSAIKKGHNISSWSCSFWMLLNFPATLFWRTVARGLCQIKALNYSEKLEQKSAKVSLWTKPAN